MRSCALCKVPAKTICESDQAALCWDCDAKVHGANFLVARHSRTLLCHACQSPTPWTASGARLGHTVSLCDSCVNGVRTAADEESGDDNHDDMPDDGDADRDDGDRDDDDDVMEDGEDDEADEEGDVPSGSDGGGDEDGDNQVVPWSSMTPPPASSSSSSDESVCRLNCGDTAAAASYCSKRTRGRSPGNLQDPDSQEDHSDSSSRCIRSVPSAATGNNGTTRRVRRLVNAPSRRSFFD